MPDTKFTLRPSFIEILYHSVLSPHTMRIPTRQWSPTDLGSEKGSYINWEDDGVDAADMIAALTDAIAACMPDTASIDSYKIWNYPGEANLATPVRFGSLATDGTDATPGQNGAVQTTWFFYDENFKPFKLVLLDGASKDTWVAERGTGVTVVHKAVADIITAPQWAFQSRQNGQINNFYGVTETLNKHLRMKYGYA